MSRGTRTGVFTYDPNGQFEELQGGDTATDTFSYTLSDGHGGTDSAMVTITIGGVANDPPVARDDAYETLKDTRLVMPPPGLLTNDSDPNPIDLLAIKSVDTSGTLGLVLANANGSFAYDPLGMFDYLTAGDTATDTFRYTLTDGEGGTDTATVTITIKASSNNAPEAMNDGYVTDENTPLNVAAPGVLENDLDDSPSLSAVEVEAPMYGTLNLNADGSFTYTPNVNFNREDSFKYLATDGELQSEVVIVFITVNTIYPWHNGLTPLDASNDGIISPLDALLGVNSINAAGSRILSQDRPRPLTKPFYDTTRDGLLSAHDVLVVVNFLNQQAGGGGEGEAGDHGFPPLSGVDRSVVVAVPDNPIVSPEQAVGDKADTAEGLVPVWSGTPSAETGLKQTTTLDPKLWREWTAASVNEDLEAVLDDLCEDFKHN